MIQTSHDQTIIQCFTRIVLLLQLFNLRYKMMSWILYLLPTNILWKKLSKVVIEEAIFNSFAAKHKVETSDLCWKINHTSMKGFEISKQFFRCEKDFLSNKYAILNRGLYIYINKYYPIFKSISLFSRSIFQKIISIRKVSFQSRLWWRTYGT